MGQNAIEVILDTSSSMKEEIFSSIELTKFKLAKEMIFHIFGEWNSYDCNHKLYIRLLQNSKIITIKNINEITKIEANEKIPISQIVETSIENLNNIDGEYKNKIILIITDGKSNYHIDEEQLSSKIKIYTMEIKGSNGVENQTLQNLSKKTKGLSYSVFLKDIDDRDIDKMYSKIKRYFKCIKLPSIGFLSLFVIAIPLYLITPKGCENSHIVFPPIAGCSSTFNKPIENQEIIKKSNAIGLCKEKSINSIKIQKCTNSKKAFEAIIYNYNSLKIISLKNFATADSNLSEEYKTFLKNILDEVNIKSPKSVKIFGHTDLEKVKNFNQNCKKYHVKENTNECLGNDRAFQVKRFFSDLDYKNISAKYNNDFFMRNMNNKLGGTLWRALELNAIIKSLMIELNIKENYNVHNVRIDEKIQQKIKNKKTYYRKKFKLFRNVIILIEK